MIDRRSLAGLWAGIVGLACGVVAAVLDSPVLAVMAGAFALAAGFAGVAMGIGSQKDRAVVVAAPSEADRRPGGNGRNGAEDHASGAQQPAPTQVDATHRSTPQVVDAQLAPDNEGGGSHAMSVRVPPSPATTARPAASGPPHRGDLSRLADQRTPAPSAVAAADASEAVAGPVESAPALAPTGPRSHLAPDQAEPDVDPLPAAGSSPADDSDLEPTVPLPDHHPANLSDAAPPPIGLSHDEEPRALDPVDPVDPDDPIEPTDATEPDPAASDMVGLTGANEATGATEAESGALGSPDPLVTPPVSGAQEISSAAGGMQGDALMDVDTGLFSESYFRVALDARISAARRHLRPIAVVLIEVVRDLGTPDATRANPDQVADGVRRTLRDADTACRMSDGSFALLLEDTPENGAVWTVERVRRQIVAKHRNHTLWAGVACYPAHAFSTDELLEQAALALQSAQEWKQDRIEVAVAD